MFGAIEIANERDRRRRAARFADPDAETNDEQLPEIARQAGGRRQQAPGEHADHKDTLTAGAVSQPAERNADEGVEQREGRAERTKCGVAEAPFTPNPFPDRSEDLAVEKIQQVDGEEHRKRVAGACHRLTRDSGIERWLRRQHDGVRQPCPTPGVPSLVRQRR